MSHLSATSLNKIFQVEFCFQISAPVSKLTDENKAVVRIFTCLSSSQSNTNKVTVMETKAIVRCLFPFRNLSYNITGGLLFNHHWKHACDRVHIFRGLGGHPFHCWKVLSSFKKSSFYCIYCFLVH